MLSLILIMKDRRGMELLSPLQRIVKRYRSWARERYSKMLRRGLTNRDFSILSSNCVGGIILHNLGQRFNSPTVNLLMTPDDFVKFLERPKHYLGCELREMDAGKDYPVGVLDDIRLDFMHYPDFATAEAKWKERSGRIHWDNLYIIMVEAFGCGRDVIARFDALPYAHKVCLTEREYPGLACVYALPDALRGGGFDCGLTGYRDRFKIRRWFDDFDYVEFLNQR